MTPVVEGAPDRDRLCPEAAVREANDNRGAGAQHAADLAQHDDRLLQILDRDADHRGVGAGIGERQPRVLVEVLHKPTAEARIGGQFLGIHAVADDFAILDLGRQVADPAAHQIEQRAAGRQHGAIKLGQGRDRAVIDVLDEPRRLIEQRVVGFVETGEGARREAQRVFRRVSHSGASAVVWAARVRPGSQAGNRGHRRRHRIAAATALAGRGCGHAD